MNQKINRVKLIGSDADITIPAKLISPTVPKPTIGLVMIILMICAFFLGTCFSAGDDNSGLTPYQISEARITATWVAYLEDDNDQLSSNLRFCYDHGGAPTSEAFDNGGLPIPTTIPASTREPNDHPVTPIPMEVSK